MSKVKVFLNSNIKPSVFNNIDYSSGFSFYSDTDSYYESVDFNSNWKLKLFNFISSKLSKYDNLSHKVINHIFESVNHVSTNYPNNSPLTVQINDNGISAQLVPCFYLFKKNFFSLINGISPLLAAININHNIMFLGTQFFNEENKFYSDLKKSMSLKDSVSYIFFHEYFHNLQLSNYENNTYSENQNFNNFYLNLIKFNDKSHYSKLNFYLSQINQKDYLPTSILISNLHSFFQENYADVGALLLLRNKAISDGNYDPNLWKKQIDSVIYTRNEEKNKIKDILDNYSYDHFTTPSLESLFDTLNDFLKNEQSKILDEKSLHLIASKCTNIAMSKLILTLDSIDPNFNKQLSLLASIKNNFSSTNPYSFDSSLISSSSLIEYNKSLTSNDWIQSFNSNKELFFTLKNNFSYISNINSHIFNSQYLKLKVFLCNSFNSIFDSALSPDLFKINFNESQNFFIKSFDQISLLEASNHHIKNNIKKINESTIQNNKRNSI